MAQATEAVGDELYAPKVNSFTKGEATARSGACHRCRQQVLMSELVKCSAESKLQIHHPGAPTLGVFFTGNK
jgi:hypothetical protein